MRTAEETLELFKKVLENRKTYVRGKLDGVKLADRRHQPRYDLIMRGGMLSELSTIECVLRMIESDSDDPLTYWVEQEPLEFKLGDEIMEKNFSVTCVCIDKNPAETIVTRVVREKPTTKDIKKFVDAVIGMTRFSFIAHSTILVSNVSIGTSDASDGSTEYTIYEFSAESSADGTPTADLNKIKIFAVVSEVKIQDTLLPIEVDPNIVS